METSLHRQLKEHYAEPEAKFEVPVGGFRIDVVNGETLVEIQHGSLAAIRDKVSRLLKRHNVLVVKPIVARKRLIKLSRQGGKVVSNRLSPKRGTIFSLFDELIYFTRVFPHRRLMLSVPLIEIEEWRYPGHGRRRWRRPGDFVVDDQVVAAVAGQHQFRTAADLYQLLPAELPTPFHTGQLADSLGVERWIAQRVAYCLREMGAVRTVGKQGNAWLYEPQRKSAA